MVGHRFACDAMLGPLSRWLRFAGFDTLFDPNLKGLELPDLARAEDRWLLTTDRELASRAGPRVLLVPTTSLENQCLLVKERLALTLDPRSFFSRCSRCNGSVEPVAREMVVHLVPPFVAARATRFSRCRMCGRLYWPGTHHEKILDRLRKLFSSASGSAQDHSQR